jgi:D-alanyl-D-alanine carboxypeptidase
VIPAHRSHRADLLARLAVAVVLVAGIAACGSPEPTPPSTPASTATASPSSTPTAPPNPSIVPVPTSQLVAPGGAAAHLDAATATALQKALDGIRVGDQYPGTSAAVVFPDGSVWAGVSGSAVLAPQAPVTSDTLFSIGSISKTFVAALIGRLAEAGTVGLDDTLAKYVPDFPNAANITLRELLNHTSGIQDLFDAAGVSDAILAHPSATWTPAQVLARIGKPYFAPGAGYHYSNTNFVLLGLVAEKATGQTVAALVRSMFLAPLGLQHTYLQTEETPQGPKAHGYMAPASKPRDNSAGTMLPFTAETTAVGFAGAYVSTAADLAAWADALYRGNVLDQATLASMADVSSTVPYKPHLLYGYGLGLEESTVGGQTAWGHKGWLDGFWSAMEYIPAYHVTVVFLTNANWADPIAACNSLSRAALGPAPSPSHK